MAVVRIEKMCGCLKNSSDYEQVTEFDTIEEALDSANKMCTSMNEDFCHKHNFKSEYVDGEVIIRVQMNG